jgi:twitching motility protein PilJ
MASETDYTQLYEQAQTAYFQADYHQAAILLDRLVQDYPDDPNILLLQGHTYLGLQQYESASEYYQNVLKLSDQPELLDYAQKGLEQAQQLQLSENNNFSGALEEYDSNGIPSGETSSFPSWGENSQPPAWENNSSTNDEIDWNSAAFDEDDAGEPTIGQVQSFESDASYGSGRVDADVSFALPSEELGENPFEQAENQNNTIDWSDLSTSSEKIDYVDEDLSEFPFAQDESDYSPPTSQTIGVPTFVVGSDSQNQRLQDSERIRDDFSDNDIGDLSLDDSDSFAFDNVFSESPQEQSGYAVTESEPNEDFLNNLNGLPDDGLEEITRFELNSDIGSDFDSELFTDAGSDLSGNISSGISRQLPVSGSVGELEGWSEGQESVAIGLSGISERFVKPTVEVPQGKLGKFLNASAKQKQLVIAGAAGISSVLAALLAFGMASSRVQDPATKKELSPFGNTGLLVTLVTGVASLGTTLILGQLAANQTKRASDDLQIQFDAMTVGNFNVKATVHSEDELGRLSAKFNQMARAIATTTTEAQRRANDMEQAKEDLQRQVIRLLDDVEGAARGDLTVEAEVTADVLGAVADAFNLTITNLREIVFQVKNAAKQVNKGSTDSELFARNQSSDALRMAEELAVTLNSVQVMTESIQRVAENAREAEEVARSSSVTALKGGEAVERTVAGILQIRETVSETARKVKRLAEASQEISKIVALISQIASRTNLLALNASIQAARAGEAGRGFAIVADEVRQLADRSAKSLKEIEQIVLQIQSETGSVMTAMEEGIQQVIDVTEKSEQAKRSLEDIIEVSNRIDTLVRSITADTVKQRENSRSVAQVMQAVELTAQETSQESQRVAGSLQTLVSISRELLTSVERFRVEKGEN